MCFRKGKVQGRTGKTGEGKGKKGERWAGSVSKGREGWVRRGSEGREKQERRQKGGVCVKGGKGQGGVGKTGAEKGKKGDRWAGFLSERGKDFGSCSPDEKVDAFEFSRLQPT